MVDVASGLGMAAVDIADDPWLIAHQVESLLGDLPAYLNIRTCRHLWHAGTGSDGRPEWNRFEMIKETMAELGLKAEAEEIEEDAHRRAERAWRERLPKT